MLETNIPSCLSKVLGFFQITMANEWKGDIIIMEHVFYEKTLSRAFDLKGTGRNPAKAAPSPADSSAIMLDDQLKQSTFQRPLIVAPHERSKLMTALKSDTQFLAKVGVMDYSLLLGIDRTNVRFMLLCAMQTCFAVVAFGGGAVVLWRQSYPAMCSGLSVMQVRMQAFGSVH